MLDPAIAKSLKAMFDIQVTSVNLLSAVTAAHRLIDDDAHAARLKTQRECKELFEKLLTIAQGGVVAPSGENHNETPAPAELRRLTVVAGGKVD